MIPARRVGLVFVTLSLLFTSSCINDPVESARPASPSLSANPNSEEDMVETPDCSVAAEIEELARSVESWSESVDDLQNHLDGIEPPPPVVPGGSIPEFSLPPLDQPLPPSSFGRDWGSDWQKAATEQISRFQRLRLRISEAEATTADLQNSKSHALRGIREASQALEKIIAGASVVGVSLAFYEAQAETDSAVYTLDRSDCQ